MFLVNTYNHVRTYVPVMDAALLAPAFDGGLAK